MKIGILGTGVVGNTIGSALITKGYEVKMGSRTAKNEKAVLWASQNGERASHGTFADAAIFGDIVFNCTKGEHAIGAIEMAGAENLADKLLIDVSNPLDFSNGMPPTLFLINDTSLGETIQKRFPEARVVKALNTINCFLMVNPGKVANGDHNTFICGNDDSAKQKAREVLHGAFGWKQENILDLGDITNSRATEQMLPIWIRLFGLFGNADFNFKIAR
jgi:8-hydroxy-5-deazaflavin:NADPH oxidoreductase